MYHLVCRQCPTDLNFSILEQPTLQFHRKIGALRSKVCTLPIPKVEIDLYLHLLQARVPSHHKAITHLLLKGIVRHLSQAMAHHQHKTTVHHRHRATQHLRHKVTVDHLPRLISMAKDPTSNINKTTHLLPHHNLLITTIPLHHRQVEVTVTTHPNLHNRVAMVHMLHHHKVDIPALLANKADMGNSSSIIHRTATTNNKETILLLLLHQDINHFHSLVFNGP